MWELSVRFGDVGLPNRGTGGVVDSARGLLYTDAGGELAAGDDGSFAPGIGPNIFRMFSLSDGVLDSTSFSIDERNDGPVAVACGGPRGAFDLEAPDAGTELPGLVWFDAEFPDLAWFDVGFLALARLDEELLVPVWLEDELPALAWFDDELPGLDCGLE